MQVIGISGSPIKNSNTDRLVQAILASTGLESEFIKLSECKVQPCTACMACVKDNVCKVNDDFPEIAAKVRQAGAIVVGGYPPYGSLDAFTKSFLERLFSLRHQEGYNRGKLAVTVVTGIGNGVPGLNEASDQLGLALTMEGMEVLGQLKVSGNTECLTCGHGQSCPMSSLPWIYGDNTAVTADKFCKAEEQTEIWQQGQQLGQEIAARLKI
ncbi:Multimeric flavodoxin WrbA [Desulfuromusa kysingii]|uniref:Multimeric flavodoxin WrbA n=1 Tax=Desulfuromusa kysingii TaxID=37625 RepID=A0A1H4DG76_9BACT|nr:flavodoxin family protein [Desulfuromusa kysingii]SEA71597.1 Multimeric flavodoxin WrbA [Desulfuromusa kysingii]